MLPDQLVVQDSGKTLLIVWPDGRSDEISAGLLRRESRSAGARRAKIDERFSISGDPRIEAVDPVGTYAVNIAFSDGEARGIYPWSYLADLAAREKRETRLTASDFMTEGEPA